MSIVDCRNSSALLHEAILTILLGVGTLGTLCHTLLLLLSPLKSITYSTFFMSIHPTNLILIISPIIVFITDYFYVAVFLSVLFIL